MTVNSVQNNSVTFFMRLCRATRHAVVFIAVLGPPLCLAAQVYAADAAPRPVTPRGELAADEKATIQLFENSRDSVVYITTRAQVQDFWSRDIFSVPRGTGSGFIWDESGHVVTNYHVIQNASEATIRMANGKDYTATLVGAVAYRHQPRPQGRAEGLCDRQSVRPRLDADQRHRLRAGSLADRR